MHWQPCLPSENTYTYSEKVTPLQVRKEGSPETKLFGTLILDFSASRAVLNKCLLFKPLGGILWRQLGADRYSPSSVSSQSAHTSFPLVMAKLSVPEAAIHLPVGKFLHLQGRKSTHQGIHRTIPALSLGPSQNKATHSSPSTASDICRQRPQPSQPFQVFRGDRGHICPVFFFACLSTCTLLHPR